MLRQNDAHPIQAIIFDYGGTLDSRGDHWSEVIRRAYESEDIIISLDTYRDAYIHAERTLDGTGIIRSTDNFLAVMRKKIALQFSRLAIDNPQQADAVATRCYESARRCVSQSALTLTHLAQRYPLAIVSNFYGNVSTVLGDFGLLPLLTAVIDSTAIGIRKPDPAIFAAGIAAINKAIHTDLHPSDVLVVGDSIDKDIIPATSLGCQTALLQGIPWDPTRPQPAIPAATIRLTTLSDLLIHLPHS